MAVLGKQNIGTFALAPRLLRTLCAFLLALSLTVGGGYAQAQTPAKASPQNVRASIDIETNRPAPGDVVTVAIVMDPKFGWHDYWINPGDAGTPLELAWQLPNGVTAGSVRAPVPETLIVSGFMNHIYKAKHAFLVDVKIPKDAQPGQSLNVKVDARWSACSDLVCVPEAATLSVPLTVGSGTISNADRARFDAWRSALPVPLDRSALYQIDGKRIDIAIPYPRSAKAERVWFFAQTEKLFRYAAPQKARRVGDWLVLETEASGQAGPVEGLLRIGDGQGLLIRTVAGAIPKGGNSVAVLGADSKLAPVGPVSAFGPCCSCTANATGGPRGPC